jgi:hypothetical protein
MNDRRTFGLWTLAAGIGWAAGTILALIVLWRLWTYFYPLG